MIARLKKRFILIAMLSVFLVLGCLMLAINLVNYRGVLKNADALLDILAENGGSFPQFGPMPEDAPWMNENFREKQELPEDQGLLEEQELQEMQELPEEQELQEKQDKVPEGKIREEKTGDTDWKGNAGDFRKNGRFNEETSYNDISTENYPRTVGLVVCEPGSLQDGFGQRSARVFQGLLDETIKII